MWHLQSTWPIVAISKVFLETPKGIGTLYFTLFFLANRNLPTRWFVILFNNFVYLFWSNQLLAHWFRNIIGRGLLLFRRWNSPHWRGRFLKWAADLSRICRWARYFQVFFCFLRMQYILLRFLLFLELCFLDNLWIIYFDVIGYNFMVIV